MIVMAERGDFFCALLESGEYDLFRTARNLCYAEKGPPEMTAEHAKEVLEAALQNEDYWQSIFEDPEIKNFVLFRRNKGGNQIIGEGAIRYDSENRKTWLEGGHILETHRGFGLSRLLYYARLKFAAEQTSDPCAYTWVSSINAPSIRAAQRNGFSSYCTETVVPEDGPMIFFRRSLNDFRQPKPQAVSVLDLSAEPG